MRIIKKINFKRYFLWSIVPTSICLALSQNITEIVVILTIYIATVINQFFLVEVISEMISEKTSNPQIKYRVRKLRVVTLFLFKLLIIFAALSLGVHLMGKRVIIPLLNYVVLIFILGLSLKDAE